MLAALQSWSAPSLVVALSALAVAAAPGLVRPARAAGPAPSPLAFPCSDAELDADAAAEVAFIHAQGCVATAVSPLERDGLAGAFERVREAFADPAVRALLAAKTDWVVAAGEAWVVDASVGGAVAAALAPSGPLDRSLAEVVAYDSEGDRGCGVIGDDTMNAFSRAGSRVIALHRPFLERALHAADAEAGRRTLARALAHELTHVLGYAHPAELGAVTTAGYANTVPVFVGCVALHYPDVAAIARECGQPDDGRRPPRWSITCDASTRVSGLVPRMAVDVRLAARWVPARVVAVVAGVSARARVAVDFGVAGVPPRTVDACRVRVVRRG